MRWCEEKADLVPRYGGRHTGPESIDTAERWASLVGDRLMPLVFQEFGAVELMVSLTSGMLGRLRSFKALVLYQHYEFLSGRYSRGWILAGTAVR